MSFKIKIQKKETLDFSKEFPDWFTLNPIPRIGMKISYGERSNFAVIESFEFDGPFFSAKCKTKGDLYTYYHLSNWNHFS